LKSINCDFIGDFLRIYENGVNIDLGNIYPAIEFPVSRGTPMISPLIKWDHSEDLFVMKYEAKVSKCQKMFNINIAEPEYEYLAGHTIDGNSKV
jgi:fatty acid synthase, animal type